jgi:uroporphyrin-III C-methyltransferase
MKTKIYPKLTLIGAGPGDEELITVKGVRALTQADVVLYDALVNPALLEYAPKDAIKIFVGKRSKNHTYTQKEINRLIVELAHKHGHVVRLKGGDSFVFGRGLEEIKYAELFEIETTVIPGISSSIGVPALTGIPVTHRGTSESFWVITGTTSSGNISKDVHVAAQTDATVVILMGVSKLKEIVEVYKNIGKDDTAIAIIQNGSLPNEKLAIGNIDTIQAIAAKKKIDSPAIIVIGDVVKLHSKFPLRLSNLTHLLN